MMAPNVRAAEVEEVMASHGLTPETMLAVSVMDSVVSWSWIVDGEVACMFGVVTEPMLLGDSFPWFITTPLVEQHARAFARTCKTLLPELLEHHRPLIGWVDARYTMSVRWLEWLGAEVGRASPYGLEQKPFHPFVLGG